MGDCGVDYGTVDCGTVDGCGTVVEGLVLKVGTGLWIGVGEVGAPGRERGAVRCGLTPGFLS